MDEHVVCCIDSAEASEDGTVVSGWCLCTRQVQALAVEWAAGQLCQAEYGLSRPDVSEAFPGYPNGSECGFTVVVPGQPRELRMCLTTTRKMAPRRQVVALVFPEAGRVQRVSVGRSAAVGRGVPQDVEPALRASLERTPGLTLRLDLVNRCNLRCVMCHHSDPGVRRRPRREIDLDRFSRLVAEVGPELRQVILSCADEPLLAPHFPEALHLLGARYPHVETSFCTNGMLLDERVRRCLVETGVARIVVSLDGVNAQTVERIRVGADFRRIVGNLAALRDLKSAAGTPYPILTLDFVMMSSNLAEAPPFVELARRLGARAVDFRLLIPSQYLSEPGERPQSDPARFNAVRDQVLRSARRLGVDLLLPPAMVGVDAVPVASPEEVDWTETRRFLGEAVRAGEGRPPAPGRLPGSTPGLDPGCAELVFKTAFCPRPFSEVTIADQDVVKPCPFYRAPLGHLSDGFTLREHFFGPRFQALRRAMLRPEGDVGCLGCPVRDQLLPTTREGHGLFDRRRWPLRAIGRLVRRTRRTGGG